MALSEKNFISDAPDQESGAEVNEIDNNKTLYIDQFTSEAPLDPELVQDVHDIKDAFEQFKPNVDVDFFDAEGGMVSENLKFGEIRDFEADGGKGKLVQNSEFLSGLKAKIDVNAKMRKSIKDNRKLAQILKDAGSREELKAMLQAMLSELEGDN